MKETSTVDKQMNGVLKGHMRLMQSWNAKMRVKCTLFQIAFMS